MVSLQCIYILNTHLLINHNLLKEHFLIYFIKIQKSEYHASFNCNYININVTNNGIHISIIYFL